MDRPVKLFIVTGEPSGDALAASCIEAFRERIAPRALHLTGVGGERLAAYGLTSLFPQDEIAVMGVAAVVQRLPLLLRRIRETAAAIIDQQPDLVLTIDSPDFCFRVTRIVRKAAPHIPVVHWVCPSVWAWRPGRAAKMRAHIDKVMCLLPFEPRELEVLRGPPGVYVGHPLITQLAALRPQSQADVMAREAGGRPQVLLLPGSRRSEVSRLMEVFGAAASMIHDQLPGVRFILPVVASVRAQIEAAVASWPVQVELVSAQDKLAAFRQARVALAASGTVTLELALSGVPTVAAYRVAEWEAMIARRMVRVPSVILPNLILGEKAVPEFLQEECTPRALAQAVLSLTADGPIRQVQLAAFDRLEEIMLRDGLDPGAHAADIITQMLQA
jgi:lipid-A-disaccharide synthase